MARAGRSDEGDGETNGGTAGGLTYREAGVDVAAGDELVARIGPLAARTRIPEVLADVGGFAGLCRVPEGIPEPVLVSGTDGVGTKLKVAFATGRHDTVGIDLVAMCVNDVVTTGARPLFFLDYFGTGALDVGVAEQVVAGIARGCTLAGCALLGGETAELPGLYARGEYDLAGFCVGVVARRALIDGPRLVEAGDVLLGVASSGLHSNGYSLARKALLERAGLRFDERPEALGGPSVADVLLEPTRIYAGSLAAAVSTGAVRGICHVTGGGVPGNLPRILPEALGAVVHLDALPRPPVFDLIQEAGEVSEAEMRHAFNLGIGLVVAVAPEAAAEVATALADAGETVAPIGRVVSGPGDPGEGDAAARVSFAPGPYVGDDPSPRAGEGRDGS